MQDFNPIRQHPTPSDYARPAEHRLTPDPVQRLTAALSDRYRVERELGAGGMATVYLAHDIKHDRKVAIKVLRPELAAVIGADRFLAEIRTTANLQHPHILALFDSGQVEGTVFYVMPFVDGESLRDRLTREKQLPVPDAIRIATEVADALQYAHQHGVIHRDIKPENIMLHGGHALVADFGIALAASNTAGTRMTETGMSLGTPHYMSPEQAMGERTLDARTDVYALGCVTYEMLIGEPPFTGPTAQAIVAKVMTEKPASLTLHRDRVPPAVDDAVHTALEKLPADRFASAEEFSRALVSTSNTLATRDPRLATRPSHVSRLTLFAIALLAVAAAWGWLRRQPPAPYESLYLGLGGTMRVQLAFNAGVPVALSPDGATMVFVSDSLNRLWLKRQGAEEPTPIGGTDGASSPAFSPDGKWIAYIANGQLRKIPVDGGPATTLDDSAATFYGVAWLDDGTIAYTSPSLRGMSRVSASGGKRSIVINDTMFHGQAPINPTPLPGARGVLFQLCASNCVTHELRVLDFRSGTQKLLVTNALMGWYVAPGHLLYMQGDGTLMGVGFDLGTLSVQGEPAPLVQGVAFNGTHPEYTVSTTGTLLYVPGVARRQQTLLHQGKAGAAIPYDSTLTGSFNSFALSPDGHRAAVGVSMPDGATDIWIKELERGPFTRMTYSGHDRRPAWSPDGRTVAFIRDSGAGGDVYARPTDGAGTDRRLVHIDRPLQEVVYSHDGATIFVRTETGVRGAGDIVAVRTGTGDTMSVAAQPLSESQPAPSPDGRWVAFALVTGTASVGDISVRPFPNSRAGVFQVSNGGGLSPVWSADSRHLYYVDGSLHVVDAAIAIGSSFHVDNVTTLFDATRIANLGFHPGFEMTRNGEFVFVGPLMPIARSAEKVIRVSDVRKLLEARH